MPEQGFPGAKLIGQILSQVTKPLSRAIVKRLKEQPFLRNYVLTQLGRFYYWCEDRLDLPGARAATKQKPVDDVRAMDAGAKILMEVLVFGFFCAMIVFESRRSAKKSLLYEQEKFQKFDDLLTRKNQLIQRVENQVILTKWLEDVVAEYSEQVGCTLPAEGRHPDE